MSERDAEDLDGRLCIWIEGDDVIVLGAMTSDPDRPRELFRMGADDALHLAGGLVELAGLLGDPLAPTNEEEDTDAETS